MNSRIRLEAKVLLSENTAKLFSVCFLSFAIRYTFLFLSAYGIYSLYGSELFLYLKSTYNAYFIYSLFFLLCASLIFLTLLFMSSIKLGESFAFFTRANGGSSKIMLLFRFLKPSHSIKAFFLYLQIFINKLMWLVYFSLPFIICSVCIYYLHSISFVSQAVYSVLLAGASIIFAMLLVIVKINAVRYSAAPYYLCLNKAHSPSKAIKKSIRFTDGLLTEGAVLEYSLIGWILSCLLIIPLFYVAPYVKLTKAVFVTDAVFSKAATKESYAINILKLA